LKKENESIQREIEQTKQHIENLESVLTMIKSAKFFKLWQGYCQIMKLVKLKS
jgi:ferritin-like metal-binding protein YciE